MNMFYQAAMLGEIKEKIKALEKKAILPLKLHVLAKGYEQFISA